jgi:protein SCO1/2
MTNKNTSRGGRQAVLALAAMALPSFVALAAIAVSNFRHSSADALPVLGSAPDFALVDQDKQPFSSRDMADRVSVVNFVFTRCQTICPTMTRAMAGLQRDVSAMPDVGFVSFSVDPEYDTPARLREFARRNGADQKNWRFVTGATNRVVQSVAKGFATYVGDLQASGSASVDIRHGTTFVLVDRSANFRGFYHSDKPGLAKLKSDLIKLTPRR